MSVPAKAFHRHLSLLPYLLGGLTGPGRLGAKTGLDARYTITPQLTAVGTINPDYSNIEGSVQSIAFSHQVHAISETRPFFLEGGSDFNNGTNFNDIGAFFYSPAIARFDLGAKLYGKITPSDTIGALDTISLGTRNDFVGRYQHNFNATTTAGAMAIDSENTFQSSLVTAADAHTRLGKLQLEGVVASSLGTNAGGGAENFSANYQDKVFTTVVQYSGISNNFLAPDGYFPFVGYKGVFGFEDWNNHWRHGYWRSSDVTLMGLDWNQFNGLPLYRGATAAYSATSKNDLYVEADYNRFEFLGKPDNFVNIQAIQGFTNRFFQYGAQLSTGVQGGEKTTSVGPSASIRVLKKLDLNYTGLIQNRLGVVQQHILTANYEISPTKSFGGRVVTQNSDTNVYLFYHSSGGKGTDLYLLYGDPNALRSVNSFQVKVVFSF